MHVRQGYYAFQDYAVQHCLDHFERRTGLESHEDIYQQTMESAREFLAQYSNSIPLNLAELSHQDIAIFFSQLPKNKREMASTLSIEYSTLDIRAIIEQICDADMTPEEKALISSLYGNQITYKCPKIWCDYFSTGFDNNEDRHTHVDSHERPFRCPDEGCFAFQIGCSSKASLEGHMIKYHSPAGEELRFPKAMKPRHNDTLIEAAGRNDLAAMLAFLESGAAVEVAKPTGSKSGLPENVVPICRAAKNGHVEACKLLLEWGAILCGKSISPIMSPMYHAINGNHLDVVYCLLSEAKVGTPAKDLSQWIMTACTSAQPDTVRILVESSHFRSYGKGKWKREVPGWIQAACKNSTHDPNCVAIVKYLLGKGFSNSVWPSAYFDIKKDGANDIVSLLRPMSYEEVRVINPALMDYHTQLMLLEQQNKKLRMMAMQEQNQELA